MDDIQKNQQTVQELNALIETHLDAMSTVKKAVEGVVDGKVRQDALDMIRDHSEAVAYLSDRVRALGGEEATSEHATNVLKESWQKLWNGGGDREVLQALRANERVSVDGLQLQMTKENMWQTMTDEGVREHMRTLEMELRHFQILSDRLREMGVQVDNDEVMGAVRNAAEHVHAAINLSGQAVESFFKWATGARG
jgi:hypothetical protein